MEPLRYLEGIYTDLEALGLDGKISIDLGLVHRNDYYTGVVFRGYVEGAGQTAVSGGRYDRLLGEFGAPMPATGFGVDDDRLARVLLARGEGIAHQPPEAAVFGPEGYEMKALIELRARAGRGVRCISATACDRGAGGRPGPSGRGQNPDCRRRAGDRAAIVMRSRGSAALPAPRLASLSACFSPCPKRECMAGGRDVQRAIGS